VTAVITIAPSLVYRHLPRSVKGTAHVRSIIEHARLIPKDVATVFMHLPTLGTINHLNRNAMNIFEHMSQAIDKVPEFPDRLVCPASSMVPTDGLMEFMAVEKLEDVLRESKPNAVLMFREDQRDLLKCYVEYSKLFGTEPVVLAGVPGIDYTAEFDSDTWSLRRVTYHSMVNDLLEANRRDTAMQAEVKHNSQEARERAAYTKKSGHVKEFNAFKAPGATMDDGDVDMEGDNLE